jgi:hypothetical protein
LAIFWASIKIGTLTKHPVNGLTGRKVFLSLLAVRGVLDQIKTCPLLDDHYGQVIGKINRAKVWKDWLIVSGRHSTCIPNTHGLSWELIVDDYIMLTHTCIVRSIGVFKAIAVVKKPASKCTRIKTLRTT